MRTLLLVLALAGCTPPLAGARCLTDSNCPDTQVCGRSCECSFHAKEAEGLCGGYHANPTGIGVDAVLTDVHAQISADGQVIAANVEGLSPSGTLFRRQADGSWASVFVLEQPTQTLARSVAISPSGAMVAAQFEAKVQVFTLGTTATSPVDLWLTSANTLAFGAQTVVASFPSRGVWRKHLGDDAAFDGTQLDAQTADALTVSNDGGVIAAQFGAVLRVFGGPLGNPDGGATSFPDVKAFALAGSGNVLALAGTDGGVRVATSAVPRVVSMVGARDVALDGEGRTLVILKDAPFAAQVFSRRVDEWTQVGDVDTDDTAQHVALSHDGETLVFSAPSRRALGVFTRVK